VKAAEDAGRPQVAGRLYLYSTASDGVEDSVRQAGRGKRNSEKKRVYFACFRTIAKSSLSSENDVQNEAKQSETKQKEAKKGQKK
jgi:hypothetical protein